MMRQPFLPKPSLLHKDNGKVNDKVFAEPASTQKTSRKRVVGSGVSSARSDSVSGLSHFRWSLVDYPFLHKQRLARGWGLLVVPSAEAERVVQRRVLLLVLAEVYSVAGFVDNQKN